MKSIKKFIKEKKAVFGLTSVQAFFVILLAVALFAYVIVVILGQLDPSQSTVLDYSSKTVSYEIASINSTGWELAKATTQGFKSPTIVTIYNASGGLIPSTNYTLLNNKLYNATAMTYIEANITYTYKYYSTQQIQLANIIDNTSSGTTSFFTNISPVFSILAILVIILVLVVLVRVVTNRQNNAGEGMVKL